MACKPLLLLTCFIPVGAMDGNRIRVRFPFLRFPLTLRGRSGAFPPFFSQPCFQYAELIDQTLRPFIASDRKDDIQKRS